MIAVAAVIAAVGLVALIVSIAWTHFERPADADPASWLHRLVVIATALLGVVTAGGGAALAYRRQAVLERQEDREHSKAIVEEARLTREESRENREQRSILHTAFRDAANQVGDVQPIVRIAGLYALERIGTEAAAVGELSLRDACIDTICAYLRSPTGVMAAGTDNESLDASEHDVRDAAVDVLARHLRPDAVASTSGDWSDRRFDFSNAIFAKADFSRTVFMRLARFENCRFHLHARFDGAEFRGTAVFERAKFRQSARFDGSQFRNVARMTRVRFSHNARFDRCTFSSSTMFEEAEFRLHTNFARATFEAPARFRGARFLGDTRFSAATFEKRADFSRCRFEKTAKFVDVRFSGTLNFSGSHFFAGTSFARSTYAAASNIEGAHFLGSLRIAEAKAAHPVVEGSSVLDLTAENAAEGALLLEELCPECERAPSAR